MPLLAIKMPANVIVVFRGFTNVINLNVIDQQTVYDFTFGRFVPNKLLEGKQSSPRILSSSSSEISSVETLGYAQSNLTRDMLLALLAVLVLSALIVAILLL